MRYLRSIAYPEYKQQQKIITGVVMINYFVSYFELLIVLCTYWRKQNMTPTPKVIKDLDL